MRIKDISVKIDFLALILGLLFVLAVSISVVHSFDVFWQLQSGKYIWQTKSFLYKDTFSLASDSGRFEHCWLHDLILYFFYYIGGYAAISILKGLLITLATGLAVLAARMRRSSCLAIVLVFPFVAFASRGGWLERPQLWSFMLFALFVYILESYRAKPGRYVWILLPLMMFWSNLHAGAVLAYPVVLAYLVGEGAAKVLKRPFLFSANDDLKKDNGRLVLSKKDYIRLVVVFGLLFLASLITPYSSKLLLTVLHSAAESSQSSGSMTKIYNMDWRAPSFAANPYFYYLIFGAATLLLVGWRRLSFTDILLLGGLGYMGLGLVRHTTFFYIAILAIVPFYVDTWLQLLINMKNRFFATLLRIVFIFGAFYSLYYFGWPAYNTYGFMSTGLREWHYPIEASDFLKENRLRPNIYNTYDWGGYLMWTLYPDYKVFWDGRSTSPEMFNKGFVVMTGRPGWDRILDEHDVNTVVTKACTVDNGARYPIIDRLRNSTDWALVFADESSMVFVRTDSVDAVWLQRHRLPDSRVDDTILSEAKLLYSTEPRRYEALWEVAQIYLKRKQYAGAYNYLYAYVTRSPHPSPVAKQSYQRLAAMRSNVK